MDIGIVVSGAEKKSVDNQKEVFSELKLRKVEIIRYNKRYFFKDFKNLLENLGQGDNLYFSSSHLFNVDLDVFIVSTNSLMDRGISLRFEEEDIFFESGKRKNIDSLVKFFVDFKNHRDFMAMLERKKKKTRDQLQGRPDNLDLETKKKLLKEHEQGKLSVVNLCKKYSISRSTFYRYLEKER